MITKINVSYFAPIHVDNGLEKEILEIAKTSGGIANGGSSFSFLDARRNFGITFPNPEQAQQFLKNIKANSRSLKYKHCDIAKGLFHLYSGLKKNIFLSHP